MSTVTCPSSSSARHDEPPGGLDADRALGREPTLADELHEAARAVAALLDFAAVGVEDPVAEIDVGARALLHQQHLVAADAEVPVGEVSKSSGLSENSCPVRSNTTKSLPRPCIFVNRSRLFIAPLTAHRLE